MKLTDWQRYFLGWIWAANGDGVISSVPPHMMDGWVRNNPRDAGASLLGQIEEFGGRDPYFPRPETFYDAQKAWTRVYSPELVNEKLWVEQRAYRDAIRELRALTLEWREHAMYREGA